MNHRRQLMIDAARGAQEQDFGRARARLASSYPSQMTVAERRLMEGD
jgi:hypothetical protein